MLMKINTKKLFMIFIVLIMNEPPIFYNFNLINTIYRMLQIGVVFYAGIILIRRGMDKCIISVLLYCLTNIIITLLFNTNDVVIILYRMVFCFVFVYLNYFFTIEYQEEFLNIFCNILLIYTFINFLLFIKYPHGIIQIVNSNSWNNIYFLGLDNQFARIIIPALGLLFLLPNRWEGFKNIFFSFIIILSNAYVVFTCKSATLILAFVILILGIFFSKYFKIFFSGKLLFICYISIFVVFVLFNNLQITFVSDFVTYFFKKDITFSGRTVIWMKALNEFLNSPIWGQGATLTGNMIGNLSAHNIILQILLENGMIGLLLFFNIFNVTILKDYSKNNRLYKIGYMVIFSIMLSLFGEVYSLEYLLSFLLIISAVKNKRKIRATNYEQI